MRTTDSLRIGDAERDTAVSALTRHFTEGRLTQTEHEERIELAMQARTGADLRRLFIDLPRLVDEPPPLRRDRVARAGVARPFALVLVLMGMGLLISQAVPVVMLLAFAFITTRIAFAAYARPRSRRWGVNTWRSDVWRRDTEWGDPWKPEVSARPWQPGRPSDPFKG